MVHLVAGGIAGLVESSICHPLDTLKTRLQLQTHVVQRPTFQHSLIEPALRIRHSLQEPVLSVLNMASRRKPVVSSNWMVDTTNDSHAAATSSSSSSSSRLEQQSKLKVITGTTHPKGTLPRIHEPMDRFSNFEQSLASTSRSTKQTIVRSTQSKKGISKKIQVRQRSTMATQTSLGPFALATKIIQEEGFLSLYKGLSAVYMGIIPKMAIRFLAFEQYKEGLSDLAKQWNPEAQPSTTSIVFCAGLASGLTEAVLVVTPAEVCKIRLQTQYHSLLDPIQMAQRKYRNVFQTALVITREEGVKALYKGVLPTMLRQGCNQGVNFTAYNLAKSELLTRQQKSELPPWQSLIIGGLSGALGPLCNNPLDVVKTRLQRQVLTAHGAPKYKGILQTCLVISREEGGLALWKGITPRLLRIVPGQAITFMTYEYVRKIIENYGIL